MRETSKETGMEWWRTVANVVELASWLDERGELAEIGDCIRLFEKPWHWDAEWASMQAERAAEAA